MTFQFTVACLLAAITMMHAAPPSANSDVLSSSNGVFSAKLYHAVSNGSENILISPLSLNYAMTAASLGTDGNTLHEIRETLHQPEDENAIVSSYKSFTDSLKNDKNLAIATKMYIDNQFQLKKRFKNELTNKFDAGVENIDFLSKPEESRVTINKYVESKTNNLIKDLFPSGSISKDTASVIVNAIYFKSSWLYPFEKLLTEKKTFYGLDKEHQVDMMYRPETDFKYAEDRELKAKLLELPYEGGYSFCVILPNKNNGITEVENRLKSKAYKLSIKGDNLSLYSEIFKKTQKSSVRVYLPKFKFEQTHNLRHTLEQLGIRDVFTSKANFQKMTDAPVLVSDIIQKTYINVNEKHTEAAAATGSHITPLSALVPARQPYLVNADHPFIYLIKHMSSDTPLFIGRYIQP